MRLAMDLLVCQDKSPALEELLKSLLDCDSTNTLCVALDAVNLTKYNLDKVRPPRQTMSCFLLAPFPRVTWPPYVECEQLTHLYSSILSFLFFL